MRGDESSYTESVVSVPALGSPMPMPALIAGLRIPTTILKLA
jgi:hypothetical protein